MKRLLALATLLALILFVGSASCADKDTRAVREALQHLNEYIGDWKGSGAPEKFRPDTKEIWSEAVSWSWRFKGDDAWLSMTVKNGKHLKGGDLRYLPAKKRYQLTLIDKQDKAIVYDGEIRKGYLILEHVDSATKDVQQIMMNTAGDGVRFVYRFAHKPEGRTLFIKDYQVACTKEGESLGAKAKKVECIVTGGLGTMPVSYMGTNYYVCCGGCRDAFNENPVKYIKEAAARKAGK